MSHTNLTGHSPLGNPSGTEVLKSLQQVTFNNGIPAQEFVAQQFRGIARLLAIKPLEGPLDFESPEFAQFCAKIIRPMSGLGGPGHERRAAALEILEGITSGKSSETPQDFRYDLVIPQHLSGGIIFGRQFSQKLANSYFEDPALCTYLREELALTSDLPEIRFHLRRGYKLTEGLPASTRYSAQLVILTNNSALESFESAVLQEPSASLQPSENVGEKYTVRYKLADDRITLRCTRHVGGHAFLRMDTRYIESFSVFEQELLPVLTSVFKRLLPNSDLDNILPRCLEVARESDKLPAQMEPCELHEFHPIDSECARFLFGKADEKVTEAKPGKGDSYPMQSPVRDCANNIIAIGGGFFLPLIPEMIQISGKDKPKVLIIPTASVDDFNKSAKVIQAFEEFNCECRALNLIGKSGAGEEVAKRIREADIIFVPGGNTHLMMRCWSRLGVDKLLEEAALRGALMAGFSAGAICWCQSGNSDSLAYYGNSPDYVRVRGLDFIDAMLVPHWNSAPQRRSYVYEQMTGSRNVALCLDDGAAIHVRGEEYRIISAPVSPFGFSDEFCFQAEQEGAYRVYWDGQKVITEVLPIERNYRPIAELVTHKKTFPEVRQEADIWQY